jgi:peptidoglycan/LPS O-acetylase OafA/YrhL
VLARFGRYAYTTLCVPPRNQFAALNGLRGFGAWLVVLIHVAVFTGVLPLKTKPKAELSPFLISINGFWVGLDLFFVLSGFLIGRILISNLVKRGELGFRDYFIRRWFRIFPPYYVVLTLALLWYVQAEMGPMMFFLRGYDIAAVRATAWANYLYVANYAIPVDHPNVISWAWSLCVEEQFYLFFPLMLLGIFRARSASTRAWLIGLGLVIPLLGRLVAYLRDPGIVLLDGFYYQTHNRVDEIFVGVMIAYAFVVWNDGLRALCQRLSHGVWLIGVALILSVWVFGGLQERGFFAVVLQFHLMALGAGFLMLNGLFNDNAVTRFFAHPFWYPFARISYGTYLLHAYVLFWVVGAYAGFADPTKLSVLGFLGFFLVVMLATELLAVVSFLVIEQPMLDLAERLTRRERAPQPVAIRSTSAE